MLTSGFLICRDYQYLGVVTLKPLSFVSGARMALLRIWGYKQGNALFGGTSCDANIHASRYRGRSGPYPLYLGGASLYGGLTLGIASTIIHTSDELSTDI